MYSEIGGLDCKQVHCVWGTSKDGFISSMHKISASLCSLQINDWILGNVKSHFHH